MNCVHAPRSALLALNALAMPPYTYSNESNTKIPKNLTAFLVFGVQRSGWQPHGARTHGVWEWRKNTRCQKVKFVLWRTHTHTRKKAVRLTQHFFVLSMIRWHPNKIHFPISSSDTSKPLHIYTHFWLTSIHPSIYWDIHTYADDTHRARRAAEANEEKSTRATTFIRNE